MQDPSCSMNNPSVTHSTLTLTHTYVKSKQKGIGPLEKEDGSFMSNDLETIDSSLTF